MIWVLTGATYLLFGLVLAANFVIFAHRSGDLGRNRKPKTIADLLEGPKIGPVMLAWVVLLIAAGWPYFLARMILNKRRNICSQSSADRP